MSHDYEQEFSRYTYAHIQTLSPDERLNIAEEHLARLKKGKTHWNKWSSDLSSHINNNNHPPNNFVIDLSGLNIDCTTLDHYSFPVDVTFKGSHFTNSGDSLRFTRISFSFDADFSEVNFHHLAVSFEDTSFNGQAIFDKIKTTSTSVIAFIGDTSFEGGVSFDQASIMGALDISPISKKIRNITFSHAKINELIFRKAIDVQFLKLNYATIQSNIPDFKQFKFEYTPSLAKLEIPSKENPTLDNLERYRKLKAMAEEAHDHHKEVEFFGYELRAMRRLQAEENRVQWSKPKTYVTSLTNQLRSLPNLAYDLLSNYGQSLLRPTLLIILLWAGNIAFTYLSHTPVPAAQIQCPSFNTSKVTLLDYSTRYSTFVTLPIAAATIKEKQQVIKCLFGNDVPPLKHKAFAIVQQIGSLIGLFLFGLALRNRFKIK